MLQTRVTAPPRYECKLWGRGFPCLQQSAEYSDTESVSGLNWMVSPKTKTETPHSLCLHFSYNTFSVPVLVHVHPYQAEAHLFRQCQGQRSVPCLSTEWSAHTSHTNWPLGVKRAQAWYGLPSVSAPLECKAGVEFDGIITCH